MSFSLLGLLAGFTSVTPTVEFDSSLAFVELHGYKFYVRTFGDKASPPLIVSMPRPLGPRP